MIAAPLTLYQGQKKMPSTSEKQRRFMGMALAMKRGAQPAKGAPAKAAAGMTTMQLADFAKKPVGKPRKTLSQGA